MDSSPEALRKRLGHGNIYPPDQVGVALATEFQTARLAALREVGLRLVAEHPRPPPTADRSREREPQDVLVAVSSPDRARWPCVQHGPAAWPGAAARPAPCWSSAPRRAAGHRDHRAGARGVRATPGILEREGDPANVIPQAVRQISARQLVVAAPPLRPPGPGWAAGAIESGCAAASWSG